MKGNIIRGIVAVMMILALILLLPSPRALMEIAPKPLPIDLSPGPVPNAALYGEDGMSYQDASLSVTGGAGRRFDTNYIFVRVRIVDASQLRTASAGNFHGQSATLGRVLAKRQNAVAAINGDFFVMDPFAVAIRQGTLYRNRPAGEDVLLIDDQGDFHIARAPETKEQVEAALRDVESAGRKVVNAFTFGPALVEDGRCLIPDGPEFSYFNAGAQALAQRISFSQIGPLEYLIIATEGPDNADSRGMTLYEIAKTTEEVGFSLSEHGCILSYNLDGGSSSTVIINNEKINAPGAKSRHINDIIYFATLIGQ